MEPKFDSSKYVEIVSSITAHQTVRIAGVSVNGNFMTAQVNYNFEQKCWHMEVRSHKGAKLFYTFEVEKAVLFLIDLIANDRFERVQLIK